MSTPCSWQPRIHVRRHTRLCLLKFPMHVYSLPEFTPHVYALLEFPTHVYAMLKFPMHVYALLECTMDVYSLLEFPTHIYALLEFPTCVYILLQAATHACTVPHTPTSAGVHTRLCLAGVPYAPLWPTQTHTTQLRSGLEICFASLRHGHAAAMDTCLRPAGVPYTRLGPAGVPSACLRPAGVPHSCLRPGAGCRASAHGATHAFIC